MKASLLRFAENTPPYFVITTDQSLDSVTIWCKTAISGRAERAGRSPGKTWGRTLGNPARPALFSVRSGARVSMPGMMTTITNVGINDEIAEGLARNVDPWFAYDCYRRFLQEFTQAVFGVGRDEFQELIDESKTDCESCARHN